MAALHAIDDYCPGMSDEIDVRGDIFMYGPVTQKIIEHSQPMLQRLTSQIERAGIKVIGQSPIEIPDQDLGNTINHIQPYVKQEYTRKIHDLVAASLR